MTARGFLPILCLALCLGCQAQEKRRWTWDDWNAMDEYVHRDDGWFSWRILSEYRYDQFNVTMYNINMTSQKWTDESWTSRPYWVHTMGVCIPDEIWYPDAGMLAITGGSNPDEPDPQNSVGPLICALAASESKTVVGFVRQIPNQRMVFTNDPDQVSRSEDRIIAWTWRTYIDMPVKNPEVILRMPMTKGAKRGLDTIAEVAKFKRGLDITRFGVTGASKRGWTTWSLSATDRRVVVSFPMVLSLLNMEESALNHFRALNGQWAWALKDYWDAGILDNVFSQEMQDVMDYEDMIRYAPRLTMPKLEFASVGDEFFSLTDTHPWWDEMPGPKYLLMFANAEHTMAPHYLKLAKSLMGVWHSFMTDTELPEITWNRYETGSDPNRVGHIEVFFKEGFEPIELIGFHSTLNNKTEGRRDFRMIVASNAPCGSGMPNGGCDTRPHLYLWRRDGNITQHSPTHYEMTMPQPAPDSENLWTGFFIEAQFNSSIRGYPLHFTTEVQMVPDRFPHPGCFKDPDCKTNLV